MSTAPTVVPGPMDESQLALRLPGIMERNYARKFAFVGQQSVTPGFMALSTLLGYNKPMGTFNRALEYHIEGQRYSPLGAIDTVAAPALGASITVTLTTGYNATGTQSLAQVGIQWLVGNTRGFSTAINTATPFAHTITLSPITGTFPAFPAGTPIIGMMPSAAESAVSTPHLLERTLVAYDHRFQDAKWSVEFTNFSMLEGLSYFDISADDVGPWSKPGMTRSWTHDMLKLRWEEIQCQVALSTIHNDRNRITPRAAGAASFTDGLVPSIQRMGNNFLTPSGAYQDFDFNLITSSFINNRGGANRNKRMTGGWQWKTKVDQYLDQKSQNNSRDDINGDIYRMNWKTIDLSGVMYDFGQFPEFDNPDGMGAFGYSNNMVIVPGEDDTVKYSDGTTGPKMAIMYFSNQVNTPLNGTAFNNPFNFSELRGGSFTGGGQYVRTQSADNYFGEVNTRIMTYFQDLRCFGFSN